MSNFPRGRSGLGLLILRLTATVLIFTISGRELVEGSGSFVPCIALALAILVTLGLFTPASSSLAGLLTVALSFTVHNAVWQLAATVMLLCVSLAMLGAGGY